MLGSAVTRRTLHTSHRARRPLRLPFGPCTVQTPPCDHWRVAAPQGASDTVMRAVCIARHPILSEHFCSFFRDAGMECVPAVGAESGVTVVRAQCPDVVVCDYDLLRPALLREWQRDSWLNEIPIIAVSMTRRPEEARLAA